jgi:metal-responsive CopG/Arc/MetJ family transcriptional regulator
MQAAPPVRRLNVNLPENVAEELEDIANKSHRSMTDIVRTALALVKIANDASENQQKLVIADQSGKPIKEIVLPR